MRLSRRGAVIAVAAVALPLGVFLKLDRAPPPPERRDAVAWFAAHGMHTVGEEPVLPGLGYRLTRMVSQAGADGCAWGVIALEHPEEIVPLLRRRLPGAAWTDARLWADGLEPWTDDQSWLPLRLLLLRLEIGAAPHPALVLRLKGECRPPG